MILANLTRAIRQQNWFAVAVEFLIVIAGVVIGFQITAWNAERVERRDEFRLLEQLYQDVQSALSIRSEWIDNMTQRSQSLSQAIDLIQNPEHGDELTGEMCLHAWSSHILIWRSVEIATLDELISSGSLRVITDRDLRRLLLDFRNQSSITNEYAEFIREDLANLVDNHAEMFPRRLDLEANQVMSECRLGLIRANQTVQNKLISNLRRTNGLNEDAQREEALLLELSQKIAAAIDKN